MRCVGLSGMLCSFVTNFMLPKRRCWTDEQKMKSGFSTVVSMVRIPNRVLTPLKRQSKIRISSFVHPSNIFAWGAYILLQIQKHHSTNREQRIASPCCPFSIWATNHRKVHRNDTPDRRFRMGRIKCAKNMASSKQKKIRTKCAIRRDYRSINQKGLHCTEWLAVETASSHLPVHDDRCATTRMILAVANNFTGRLKHSVNVH